MIALVALAAAIPREDVLDNAAAYTVHTWTSTDANQSASDCSSVDYESDYPPGTYTGLPYDWGGYVTLDEFDAQIADGYGAGSHSWHGSLSCTTGVDCSGFVSMIWETGHYSTSTFYGVTEDIEWSELERADAVNDAGSHMVLFAYETGSGTPVFYEASGSGQKVRLNSTSSWSYIDGYQPIRFDDIEDGPSTGTSAAPREITAFPFTDLRWTAGAASDAIDSYACAPDADESGPEVLYFFEAATSGTLQVVVSDDSGVDIDVHVLDAPEGDACLARDDTEVEVEVSPGMVWIAMDTYVGGDEYPGPYLMTATFTGTLGEAPADTGGAEDSAADAEDSGSGEGPAEDSAEGIGVAPSPGRLVAVDEMGGCGCGGAGVSPAWLLASALILRRRRT